MGNRITGSTKGIEVLVALGQRSAERLGRNAVLAELAPAVGQATENLVKAKDVRKTTANARWLTRQAMDEADKAVTDAVRAAQHHALEACNGAKGDSAYQALFPDGLKHLVVGNIAQREQALKSLAARLDAAPAQATLAKRLADALAVRQAAVEAWKEASRDERAAVLALAAEARSFQKECSLVRYQAIIRLKDAAAARAYFPTVAPKSSVVVEPEPPGVAKPQPVHESQQAA